MLVPPQEVLIELRRRLRELDAPPGRLDHLSLEDLQIELLRPFCDYFVLAWLDGALPERDACDRETMRTEARRLRDVLVGEIVGHTLDKVSIEGIEQPFPPPAWETRQPLSLRLGLEPLSPRARIQCQIDARHGYLEREIPYRFRHIFRGDREWVLQQLKQAVPPSEIETVVFSNLAAPPAGSGVAPAAPAGTISTSSRQDLLPLLKILHWVPEVWSARTAGVVPADPVAFGTTSIYSYLKGKTRNLRPANEKKLYLVVQEGIKTALAGQPKPAEQQVLRAWLGTPLPG